MTTKSIISFRLVAYTDAAGKYSPDAYRCGNEDNFFVSDLTDDDLAKISQNEVLPLGKNGLVMAVADGMGGMNAGEVASQIAVDTVKDAFARHNLTENVVSTSQSRQKFLESVIRKADTNIKIDARKDISREGMGSTIILAWLFNDELTISWCGDSRAYVFNEKTGIRLVSRDHSYVQELVNEGKLTYDQTFDHPQGNIITRSLGDPTRDAKPESKTLKVGKGDVILLCSDGLSGVLRDRKTYDANGQLFPEDNLEDIIRLHTSSMKECREALWASAEIGGWYDNVTAILCQIVDGPELDWNDSKESLPKVYPNTKKKILWVVSLGLFIVGAVVGAFFLGRGRSGKQEPAVPRDSVQSEQSDSVQSEEIVSTYVEDTLLDASSKVSIQEENSTSIKNQISMQSEAKVDSVDKKSSLTKKFNRDKIKDTLPNKSKDHDLTPKPKKSEMNSELNSSNADTERKTESETSEIE